MQVPISFIVVFKENQDRDKIRIVIRTIPDVVNAKTLEMLEGCDGKDVLTIIDADMRLDSQAAELRCQAWKHCCGGCENVGVHVGIYLEQ